MKKIILTEEMMRNLPESQEDYISYDEMMAESEVCFNNAIKKIESLYESKGSHTKK